MCAPERIIALCEPIQPGVRPEDIRRAVVYVAHQRIAEHYRRGRAFLDRRRRPPHAPLQRPRAECGSPRREQPRLEAPRRARGARNRGPARQLRVRAPHSRREDGRRLAPDRRGGHGGRRHEDASARCGLPCRQVVPRVNDYLRYMRFITPPNYADGVAVPAPSRKRPARGRRRAPPLSAHRDLRRRHRRRPRPCARRRTGPSSRSAKARAIDARSGYLDRPRRPPRAGAARGKPRSPPPAEAA